MRRRLLDEWRAWRKATTEKLGLTSDGTNVDIFGRKLESGAKGVEGREMVEEIVEEVIDETEEVLK